MPLPPTINTVPVHISIMDGAGVAATGFVSFQCTVARRDGTSNVIIGPSTFVATLVAGQATINLPATDDPDVTPQGWTYTVSVSTNVWTDSFQVSIPVATVGTLEFADIAPAVPTPSVTSFVQVGTYNQNQQQALQEQRVDVIRRGKGGSVGTGGKGVLQFRFDHALDPLRTTLWPLMVARGLPGSVGVVTRSVENPAAGYEPSTTTWAQLQTMMSQGLEVWAHSCTHSNGTSLFDEIVTSKAELEAHNIRVMGWQQPGAPATYGAGHTSVASMDDEAGRLIRSTYGLFESSIAGSSRRTLPTYGCWGHDHVTIDDLTYPVVKDIIDLAINMKVGVQLVIHPGLTGTAGHISLADMTSVMDYAVTKRDAGVLEVLTATGLAFADPSHSRRLDLVADGTFEGLSTGTLGYGWSESAAGSWTIGTDGGHSGSNYLRVPNTGTRCGSATGQTINLGLDGHTFIFDGWTRSTAVGGGEYRVRLRDVPTDTAFLDVHAPLAQSNSWTHVRVPFTIPLGVSILAVEVGRWSGGSVDWDDVHAYAV